MNRLATLFASLSILAAPALARAGSVAHGHDDDEDEIPSKEPFSNSAQAFQSAKEELLKGYYRDTLTEDELYRAAVQGMLERIDPHLKSYNRLLSPEAHQFLKNELKGQLIGIGVEIKLEDDGLIDIQGVIPGGPAEDAGLTSGDRIVSVDGKSFKGSTMTDVAMAIRGQEGSTVKLQLIHDGKVLNKSIRRAQVTWEPVHLQTYEGGVVQLSLADFSERTGDALRKALARVLIQKPKGLIIDLRGNHGGLLEEAVSTAKFLLPAGTPIAQIVRRGGSVENLVADGSGQLPLIPAVILVDGGTMSSAELLASALRSGLHAPLIGKTTKGKWSIQTLQELPNHYVMKYTVGAFRTPSGESFEGKGLAPDVEVAMEEDAFENAQHLKDAAAKLAADPQLRAAVNLLRMRP